MIQLFRKFNNQRNTHWGNLSNTFWDTSPAEHENSTRNFTNQRIMGIWPWSALPSIGNWGFVVDILMLRDENKAPFRDHSILWGWHPRGNCHWMVAARRFNPHFATSCMLKKSYPSCFIHQTYLSTARSPSFCHVNLHVSCLNPRVAWILGIYLKKYCGCVREILHQLKTVQGGASGR